MENFLQSIFNYLIGFVEACGAIVILVGVGRAFFGFISKIFLKHAPLDFTNLRIQLGQCLVLALELQVAADILKTGVSPTWEDILLLGSIIALRTILNYLLERELRVWERVCPIDLPLR